MLPPFLTTFLDKWNEEKWYEIITQSTSNVRKIKFEKFIIGIYKKIVIY
jgi:hypothetical protein